MPKQPESNDQRLLARIDNLADELDVSRAFARHYKIQLDKRHAPPPLARYFLMGVALGIFLAVAALHHT